MRKIALVTTSRADYGIQTRLISMLQADADVDFHLFVSGTHLSEKHGMTCREIEEQGHFISSKVDIGIDQLTTTEEIFAKALIGFSKVFAELRPDIVVMLGDRYEMFAAAVAAVLKNIPIAHLHGGELTQGANDDIFRHSITKAAYLHFTSCEDYRRRVIQLGEEPSRVFNVGALSVENIKTIPLWSKEQLSENLKVEFSSKNLLVTFHPVTLEKGEAGVQIDELLSALDTLEKTTIVFTHPNADAEGDLIAEKIQQFVSRHARAYLFKSLGMVRYLSMVRCVDAVVGNSSSGVIEVPSLKTATVNIGNRQQGRIQAPSIVNCNPSKDDVLAALKTVFSPEFQTRMGQSESPYDKINTALNIVKILKEVELPTRLKKRFYDVPR